MAESSKKTDRKSQFSVIIGTHPEVLLLSIYREGIAGIDPPKRLTRHAGLVLARERLQTALAAVERALTGQPRTPGNARLRRVPRTRDIANLPDIPA
jgi:hypothetical protein